MDEERPPITKDKAQTLQKFFRHSYIRLHNLTRSVAEAAQDVVWNHAIRPKDAIHIATALSIGVPTFETFDGDLLKKSGLIGSPPLLIRQPIAVAQTELRFDKG